MKAASALDYRELARVRLPRFLFDYVDGGSSDEVTLRRNLEDLRAVSLRQRVLRDVSSVDPSVELLGQRMAMPLALGPIGLGGLLARRGEVQAARAAEEAGVPFCLSTVGACSLREVAGRTSRPLWFQLYMVRDRGFVRDLLAQARELGVSTLVFTVDLPLPGARYRDRRAGLAGSPGPAGRLRRLWQTLQRPRWTWDVGFRGRPHVLGNLVPLLGEDSALEDFHAWLADSFDPTVTWKDLEFVRSEWPGPLVLKGILDADDAVEAAAVGADGIVVSNHGGRQLDGALSSAAALPAVAAAVGDRLTILADGGVRSGLDVVRLMALGASGVLLGRAWAYALGGGGGAGVAHMLRLFDAEIRIAMALTGCTRAREIDAAILANSDRIQA